MYVDAIQDCNELAFQFGNTANGVGAVSARSWSIKVSFEIQAKKKHILKFKPKKNPFFEIKNLMFFVLF